MESKQNRMRRSNGWHTVNDNFAYYVEDGSLVRGTYSGKTVYPYQKDTRFGGYDNVSGIRANKSNYDKVEWF